MHPLAWNFIAYILAAAVIIWVGLGFLRNRARRDAEPYERSVPGVARVLKIGKTTSSRSYGAVILDLLLQVHRPGVEPYEVSTMWLVEPDAVPKVQVGQTFAVKIDPLDPTRIYSGEIWARSLGVKKTPIEH